MQAKQTSIFTLKLLSLEVTSLPITEVQHTWKIKTRTFLSTGCFKGFFPLPYKQRVSFRALLKSVFRDNLILPSESAQCVRSCSACLRMPMYLPFHFRRVLCCVTIYFITHSQEAAILNDLLEHKYLSERLNCEFILQFVDSSLAKLWIIQIAWVCFQISYASSKWSRKYSEGQSRPTGRVEKKKHFNFSKVKTSYKLVTGYLSVDYFLILPVPQHLELPLEDFSIE